MFYLKYIVLGITSTIEHIVLVRTLYSWVHCGQIQALKSNVLNRTSTMKYNTRTEYIVKVFVLQSLLSTMYSSVPVLLATITILQCTQHHKHYRVQGTQYCLYHCINCPQLCLYSIVPVLWSTLYWLFAKYIVLNRACTYEYKHCWV